MCIRDDDEKVSLFEPLMVGESASGRSELNDLALELATRSAGFRSSLSPSISSALAGLIRSMNCYYSNLIEGHNTHPIDIERALHNNYSADPVMRDLQLEAKAHIAVQMWIDEGGIEQGMATAPSTIAELHRRFCEELPADLLKVDDPARNNKLAIVPGEFRRRDVEVGRHVAISPGAVPRFLDRLHVRYRNSGKIESILASACAHHRLLWIHPFLDGNGRVARLVSYAMLQQALDTRGLWSVARGLARNEARYKQHLMACDSPRRGDLDGRGSLSESALTSFVKFFLEICIDQIDFMEGLMRPEGFAERVMAWAAGEIRSGNLPARSDTVLRAVLMQGGLPRGEIAEILGVNERTARRITSALVKSGALNSVSTRAPLSLSMPARLASFWMPGLFPERAS